MRIYFFGNIRLCGNNNPLNQARMIELLNHPCFNIIKCDSNCWNPQKNKYFFDMLLVRRLFNQLIVDGIVCQFHVVF